MDHFGNNENQNPKSHRRIGYNTAFKNNFKFQNNISSKNKNMGPRTPLKSKINLMSTNSQVPDGKEDKCIKYPLLKSTSVSYMNNNNNNEYFDEKYNENALEDEVEDYMHMNENEIYINNDEDNEKNYALGKMELKAKIMDFINPFPHKENNGNNKYVFGAHLDDDGKKEFDDYFNSPDENDLNESEN